MSVCNPICDLAPPPGLLGLARSWRAARFRITAVVLAALEARYLPTPDLGWGAADQCRTGRIGALPRRLRSRRRERPPGLLASASRPGAGFLSWWARTSSTRYRLQDVAHAPRVTPATRVSTAKRTTQTAGRCHREVPAAGP